MDRGLAIVLTIMTGVTFSLVEACRTHDGGHSPTTLTDVGVTAPGGGSGAGATVGSGAGTSASTGR